MHHRSTPHLVQRRTIHRRLFEHRGEIAAAIFLIVINNLVAVSTRDSIGIQPIDQSSAIRLLRRIRLEPKFQAISSLPTATRALRGSA